MAVGIYAIRFLCICTAGSMLLIAAKRWLELPEWMIPILSGVAFGWLLRPLNKPIKRRSQIPEAVLDMMDVPPAMPQYPVEVCVYREGLLYGTDIGVATFDGGSVLFTGLATEFSISADLIDHYRFGTEQRRSFSIPREYPLAVSLKTEKYEIGFRPFGETNATLTSFACDFELFVRDCPKEPTLHSVLPPIRPQKAALAVPLRHAAWTFGLICLLYAGGAVLYNGDPWSDLLAIGLFATVLWQLAHIPGYFRDAARLKRIFVVRSTRRLELHR